jgi:hypothetical protein
MEQEEQVEMVRWLQQGMTPMKVSLPQEHGTKFPSRDDYLMLKKLMIISCCWKKPSYSIVLMLAMT